MRKIITSALPYANGAIHIGHLVEYIQVDIIVKFLKLAGKDVVFCCADDTHGTPIEINAAKEGVKPEKFIAKWLEEHKTAFSNFHIDFDSYYSTNSKENKYFSELFYKRLKDKGLIYEKEIEQAYDKKEKRFLPDRYVKGICPKCKAEDQYGDQCESCGATYNPVDLIDAKSTLSGEKPITKKTTHFFFKLSEQSKDLKKYITENDKLQSEVKNQILQWIDNGLEDWCISRDGPYFGFKIPDTDKYFYVWLDAPIGYISSFANYLGGDVDKAEKEWNKSEIIHFIGKDITYFHLLFWPAVLQNSDMKVSDNVFVHGFLTVNKEKMSKSRGTFITAQEWAKVSKPEFLRYYYAANLTNKIEDLDLNTKDYTDRVNNELVANIANFIFRTLSFLNNYFDSELGEEVDKDFSSIISRRVQEVIDHYEEYNLRKVVNSILHISSEGNKYFQDKTPWITAKTKKKECLKTLTTCANLAKNLAILLKPILPEFANEVEKQLNLKGLILEDLNFNTTKHKIGKAEHIYEKIEEVKIGKETAKGFSALNLKVGLIKDVKMHENAEKLYVIKVDLGDEERQIVSGIKDYYEEDELVDKKIVVVTNLESAKLRGIESQGMLLAAEGMDRQGEQKLGLLTVEDSLPGEPVVIKGVNPNPKTINFKEFQKVKITTEKGDVICDNQKLKTSSEFVKVERVYSGTIS